MSERLKRAPFDSSVESFTRSGRHSTTLASLASRMAGSTGLEPAASAVTGQRSSQLNYDPNTANARIGECGNS